MNSKGQLKRNIATHSSDQGVVYMEPLVQKKRQTIDQAREATALRYGFNSILGNSASLNRVLDQARAASRNNAHVLLQGESGTGKEIFAQAIHELSNTSGPFIAINCGALPRNLVESELFGYEGGTFTGADRRGRPGKFELANGGTLFLDEIGDMPLSMQPVLLRVIEEKRVMRLGSGRYIPLSLRVVAASNQDLNSMVSEKRFRQDLYYRLSAFKINLPPLKKRGDDIRLLAIHFMQKACLEMQINPVNISNEALALLMDYDWPGNIRQLENAMTYAVSMTHAGIIDIEHLPEEILHPTANDEQPLPKGVMSLRDSEKVAIEKALEFTQNNVIKAANILGISKSTLYRKLKEYDMDNFEEKSF